MKEAIKITHVLSDGTRLDSIEGITIPAGHPAYRIIAKAAQRAREQGEHREDAKGA